MKSTLALLPALLLAVASATAQQSSTAVWNKPPDNSSANVVGLARCTTEPSTGKVSCTPVADLEHSPSRCPIAMHARQGGGLQILRADKNSNTPAQPFMTPSLILRSPQGKCIVSATITAHGYGINKGATPLYANDQHDDGIILRRDSNQSQRPHLTRTLTVKFSPDDDNTVSGDFRLPGFVVLETIELNNVIFADGSTMSFTTASGCTVQPDMLMLVGGH